ncbi:hypothetical protein B0H17DRAFT_1266121 [Mycena rosella]|uniref:RING-type domain-containing protein n=1 Tax=Mycena rosella TaxID=1033263 RepID=A0AAD7G4E6_MYCRO|nr:hypothetical protein B0H17DRAFT_1266121 [Mycena rosella]
MPSCSICYERFTSPISLPCGHVFCKECIRRTVDSIKSCSVQHFCPTCRTPYSVLTLDPGLVPPYLRPHILPPLRPVFFDDPTPTPAPAAFPSASASGSLSVFAPAPSPSPRELGQAAADATALRMSCATWRRRAEVHAAANTGLLSFARAAKEHALRMRTERDAARSQCVLLKRKLVELMCVACPPLEICVC